MVDFLPKMQLKNTQLSNVLCLLSVINDPINLFLPVFSTCDSGVKSSSDHGHQTAVAGNCGILGFS